MKTKQSRNKSAKEKALELLNFKMRSEKELSDKLEEYGYEKQEIGGALSYVKSYGYINDAVYAEQYVASKGKQKGRAALKRELLNKGIDPEEIERAIDTLEEAEEDTAYWLLIKKAGPPHKLEEREHARLCRFLISRGFSSGAVYDALKRYKGMSGNR